MGADRCAFWLSWVSVTRSHEISNELNYSRCKVRLAPAVSSSSSLEQDHGSFHARWRHQTVSISKNWQNFTGNCFCPLAKHLPPLEDQRRNRSLPDGILLGIRMRIICKCTKKHTAIMQRLINTQNKCRAAWVFMRNSYLFCTSQLPPVQNHPEGGRMHPNQEWGR